MEGSAFVYIMASQRNGTIYLGSTDNLPRRVWAHRNGVIPGFTKKYGCHLLVWYEVHETLESARLREKQIKEWRRGWKLREIEGMNPEWHDLFECIAHFQAHPNWAPAFAGEAGRCRRTA